MPAGLLGRVALGRTTFYDWIRRPHSCIVCRTCHRPPGGAFHPTTPRRVAQIGALALPHPTYGGDMIKAILALQGRPVSAITVQKAVNDFELDSCYLREQPLERRMVGRSGALYPERVASLEKPNPCSRE